MSPGPLPPPSLRSGRSRSELGSQPRPSVPPSAQAGVSAIAAGEAHALALRDDGTVVVDAVMANGQHIDPLTGKTPDLDAPLHGPWFQSQLFCDYFLKIHFDGNKGYRDELKKYLLNWQRIEGRPANDRIVSFKVWWVSNDSPPPGKTEPTNIRKSLVLESGPDGQSAPVSDNR